MPVQMPFVGREGELIQIEKLIKESGTRQVVCIHGPGGIGKTRLLEEVYERYARMEGMPLLVADIIDFDDRSLHLSENVERRIARRLGEKAFEPYFRALLDWRKMEAAGVSLEALEQQEERIRQTLVDNFNQVSSRQRVVLRFDTTDKDKLEEEIWNRLTTFILATKNVLFILAGRDAKDLWLSLQPQLGQDAKLIELKPLTTEAGEQYLEQKQHLLHTTLGPDLAQKLLFLAGGRPILIDLAVEWLSRDLPRDWMTEKSLEELKSLPPVEMDQQQKDFEIHLVFRITQMRTPMDRLTLDMSHIYPINPKMIVDLLTVSETEANALFNDAKTYAFVKTLPDGHISLHDEMRRMVNEYVWPEVDKEEDRRRRVSKLATEYLRREIQTTTNRSRQLATEQEKARQEGNAQAELDAFTTRETLERELWTLKEQLVFHTLFANTKEGVKTFVEVFDEATKRNRLSFQKLLLQQTENFKKEFTEAEKYEVEIRRVVYLLNERRTAEAKQILDTLMIKYADGDRREVDMLTRLANYAQLSGNLTEAINYLEKALAICEAQPEIMKAWGGTVLNTMGLMHRLMGKWEQAATYYRRGIDLIGEVGDEARLAAGYNNLGYVIGLQKSYDSARVYCQRAMAMQERLGLRYDSGRTHNTLGIIYRGKQDYLTSVKHTNQALSIFQEFEDKEWVAKAYCERGITRWHIGELQEADADLEKSYQIYLETGLRAELVNILHGRGHVVWELWKAKLEETEQYLESVKSNQQVEMAAQYFRESAEIGRQVLDPRQTVNSLEGLVELYYDVGYEYHKQGNTEKRDEWYDKAEEMAAQWKEEFEDQGYYFPLYSGSRIRILGNIAYDRGDYETSLQRYLEAYPRIASPWGYSRYMLPEALIWLQERIDRLLPQLALEWCDRIQEYWEEKKLDRDFPEMISVCEIGRDNAKRRTVSQEGGKN